jgi:hypothetical protein
LAIESAQAFLRLARVQGMPNSPNLGQYTQAEASLRQADGLLEEVLRTAPRNRRALLLSADVAHSLMVLDSTDHRREQTLMEARRAAIRVDTLLRQGSPSPAELAKAQEIFNNIALAHKNEHLYGEAIRYAWRSVEIARSVKSVDVFPSNPLSIAADCLRASGDLQGAFQAIQEARRAIDSAVFSGEAVRGQVLYNILIRQGRILGEDGNVSLNRPAEALQVFQQAVDVTADLAKRDPDDAMPRIRMATASDELARILVHTDPLRALSLYDSALLRSREIRNNTDARRAEARLLAHSSYALRALHRHAEAKQRIDEAFGLLRQTKDYPANRINADGEAAAVLSAWADHLADTGQPRGAAQVYRELLDKIMAYGFDPQNDLRDATRISSLDAALAAADRRLGQTADAQRLDAERSNLWREWDRKLPNNPFVVRKRAALLSKKEAVNAP